MSHYINRITTQRQFSAVLGVTQEEFDQLLPTFSKVLQEKAEINYQKNRGTLKIKPRMSHSQALKTNTDTLIFILY